MAKNTVIYQEDNFFVPADEFQREMERFIKTKGASKFSHDAFIKKIGLLLAKKRIKGQTTNDVRIRIDTVENNPLSNKFCSSNPVLVNSTLLIPFD